MSTQPTPSSAIKKSRHFLRDLRLRVESRARHGWARASNAFLPLLIASVAAALAYAIAQQIPGHDFPFFAATSAWICLGFTYDRDVRHVAELAVGATLGVALGDVFERVFGSGPVQIMVVLVISALAARFIDRGMMVTTQAGVQAIVIVGMPSLVTSGAGPFARPIDAAVGGVVALLVAVFIPGDVRRRIRSQAKTAFGELAIVLDSTAKSLETADVDLIEETMIRARRTQPAVDEWRSTMRSVQQTSRLSLSTRRYLAEIGRSSRACNRLDRAIRNARVLVRQSRPLCEMGESMPMAAAIMRHIATASRHIGDAFGTGSYPSDVQIELKDIASRLTPHAGDTVSYDTNVVIHLLRSIVVDLLEATGMSNSKARGSLPDIL